VKGAVAVLVMFEPENVGHPVKEDPPSKRTVSPALKLIDATLSRVCHGEDWLVPAFESLPWGLT